MKHLQESLGADAEQITDLKQQLEESQAIIDSFDEQAQSQVLQMPTSHMALVEPSRHATSFVLNL